LHPVLSRIHLAPAQAAGSHLFKLAADGVSDWRLEGLWRFGDWINQTQPIDAINVNDTAFTNTYSQYPHYSADGSSGFNGYQSSADPKVVINNMQIHGFSGHGIYWHARGSSRFTDIIIFTVKKKGFYFEGFDCQMRGIDCGPCGEEGFYVYNSSAL